MDGTSEIAEALRAFSDSIVNQLRADTGKTVRDVEEIKSDVWVIRQRLTRIEERLDAIYGVLRDVCDERLKEPRNPRK